MPKRHASTSAGGHRRAARRDTAAANRRAHHERRLAAATTDRGRLRAACDLLSAEAVRVGREADAVWAVLGLVRTLRDGQPLSQPLPQGGSPLSQAVPTRGARAGAREVSSPSPATECEPAVRS
jgi:hypothetical protein